MLSRFATFLHDALRRLPRFRGRNRAIKWLLGFMPTANSFYGPKLAVRAGDQTFYASYFARYGDELVGLIKALPSTGVFLEFGANTGIFSLVAARHLTDGKVFAVEPNPFVYRDLATNVLINKARNLTPLNFSIGPVTQALPFSYSTGHTGKGHIATDGEDAAGHIVLIQADEFAKLLPDLSAQAVLCKIDTEGAEFIILQGLRVCGLIDFINTFHMEIDERYLAKQGHSPDHIYVLMDECGFAPQTDRRGQQHYDEIFARVR